MQKFPYVKDIPDLSATQKLPFAQHCFVSHASYNIFILQFNFKLLLSGNVINSIDRPVGTELMGDILLKGWSEPVPIYKLA